MRELFLEDCARLATYYESLAIRKSLAISSLSSIANECYFLLFLYVISLAICKVLFRANRISSS